MILNLFLLNYSVDEFKLNFQEIPNKSIDNSGSINLSYSVNSSNPIVINSNTDFLTNFTGTGTELNPYILNMINITLTTTGNVISISHTDAYFIIENSYVSGSQYGFYFHNVSNGVIRNTIMNTYNGFYISQSTNILIYNSTISSTLDTSSLKIGAYISGSNLINVVNTTVNLLGLSAITYKGIETQASSNITISNSTLSTYSSKGPGILTYNSNNLTIENNKISNFKTSLDFYNSKNINLNGNSITTNLLGKIAIKAVSSNIDKFIRNNFTNGVIMFDNQNHQEYSFNEFVDNFMNDQPMLYINSKTNTQYGTADYGYIHIYNSKGIVIANQTFLEYGGITIANSEDVKVENSSFSSVYKSITISHSNNTIITNNTMSFVNLGVYIIHNSNNISINENLIGGSSLSGISVFNSNSININNNFLSGKASGSGTGIYISNSNYSIITGNYIEKFGDGIYTQNYFTINNYLQITFNEFGRFYSFYDDRTNDYSIRFAKTSNSLIYANMFYSYYKPILSLDSNYNNITYNNFFGAYPSFDTSTSSISYNYYSTYSAIDNNGDGISDYSLLLDGGGNQRDSHPLIYYAHQIIEPVFLFPTGATYISGVIDIIWSFGIDSWGHTSANDLFISDDNGITWTLLSSNLNGYTFQLNTSEFIDGIYYKLKLNTSTIDGLTNETQSNVFEIRNTPDQITVPTILTPNGGEIYYSTINITWTLSADTYDHQIFYNIYLSPDNGLNWVLIATDISSTTFIYTVLGLNGSDFLVKVVADDKNGLISEDISDTAFSIIEHNIIIPSFTSLENTTLSGITWINWTSAHDTWSHAIMYNLSFSADNG
ncbi:MAG: right-handed parallel beta-helix repeat-containing protein, partial [Candidatus Heimdallarchaeota archaeon]|nr:right-handed parallel beta-helix repeat-containing protein [Candidatus Heimdallarchaeota archaeon]